MLLILVHKRLRLDILSVMVAVKQEHRMAAANARVTFAWASVAASTIYTTKYN
jgi:hypothetical protein